MVTNKKLHQIYLLVIILALIIGAAFLFWPRTAVSVKSLGSCITDNGFRMYGVDTCQACQYQKSLFGKDFTNVDYVNCQFNLTECESKGISNYPTWTGSGKRFVGAQSLETLSNMSGCAL